MVAKKRNPGALGWLRLSEDWLACWVGLLLIILVVAGLPVRRPSFNWTTDGQFLALAEQKLPAATELISTAEARGEAELVAAADSLRAALLTGERAAIGESAKSLGEAQVTDEELAEIASAIGKDLSTQAGRTPGKVLSSENIARSVIAGILLLAFAAAGNFFLGRPVVRFLTGFPAVFGLAWISMAVAGNYSAQYYGLEFALWALLTGLFVSNVLRLPAWIKEAVRTEYYIKTGLVLMGTGILFGEILRAGVYGVIQAVLVVSVVWYISYRLARKLNMDDEFAAIMASGVSICGVSAAIAAAGAVQGDKKHLSFVTSIVMLVAVPMMIAMPLLARMIGLPDMVAGAWLGGTIDTTGAVVAAGALYSDTAMKIATIVKFSQNVLLGVAALFLAIVWTCKKGSAGEQPGAAIIWHRFPKFVLGFLAASMIFSFFVSPGTVKEYSGTLNFLRNLWFALAFVSIGLETNFRELLGLQSLRPALAFLGGQAVNIIWTLLLAYLLFSGIFFAVPLIG